MSKFKICPECGTKNPPNAIECEHCDWDLMSVPVTDEQQETAKKALEETISDKNPLVRVCSECGTKNPPNARKCSNCGEDISDIIPTIPTTPTIKSALVTQISPNLEHVVKTEEFVLKSFDDKITFKIDRDNIIFGREHELKDYLAAKVFVSRRHCQFTLENGELFVEDLNSANSTYVNNKKIARKTKLSRGDEVGLGGAVFNGSRQDKAAYFLVG